jgi:FkbM family methyltransferase
MNSDFTFRLGTQDHLVLSEVMVQNEYRIDRLSEEDVIVDVGAHIGAFAAVCMWSGAGKVICYEPSPDNVRLLRLNLAAFPSCVVHEAAIWRAGVQELHFVGGGGGTAVGHCLGEFGLPVPVTSLDDALRDAGTVRILKLDCEGAEWPSLYECSELWRVQDIIGELHLRHTNPAWPWDCTIEGLTTHLESQGFAVEMGPVHQEQLLFFARRQK